MVPKRARLMRRPTRRRQARNSRSCSTARRHRRRRNRNLARSLTATPCFGGQFDQHAQVLHDVFGVGASAREANDRAFLSMSDELGLDDATMIALHREIIQGVFPPSTPADGTTEVDAETAVLARDILIRETLREELGEAAAADIITRTDALIAATPELQEQLANPLLTAKAEPFLLLARHVAGR